MSNILVVEDNGLFLELIQEILSTGGGHKVICATNAKEALEILADQKNKVNVVLSDVHLDQGLSGLELIAEISKLKYDVDIVLMSSVMDKYIEKEARGKGAQHTIHKIGITKHLECIGLIHPKPPKEPDI